LDKSTFERQDLTWTIDFDHWTVEDHFRHFGGHKSEVWKKPLVDQITEMKQEFLCIKEKSDEFEIFGTSEFEVSEVLRTSDQDTARRKA
jgi:hypothetical protein